MSKGTQMKITKRKSWKLQSETGYCKMENMKTGKIKICESNPTIGKSEHVKSGDGFAARQAHMFWRPLGINSVMAERGSAANVRHQKKGKLHLCKNDVQSKRKSSFPHC